MSDGSERLIPGVWMLDVVTLCDFGAHVAEEVAKGLGHELTREDWPLVAAAVESWIEGTLDRVAFATEAQATLDALPTTDGVHTPEFGKAAPLPLERRIVPPV